MLYFHNASAERPAAESYILIGALLSCGAGFYYVTYSLQLVEYTDDSNRDSASGVTNTVSAIISLTFPMLSGILLSFFNNFTGYRILFGIVLALVLAALWASMHLAPLTNAYDGDTHTHFRDVIPQLLKSKPERSVMYMMIFNGIRTGTMTFLVNVLIYQIISSELLVGVNSFVGSILTIISAGAYGLIITVHRRQKSIFAASTCVIFCAVMLYFKMSPLTLIIFSAVNSGANIFISEPQTNLYFRLFKE